MSGVEAVTCVVNSGVFISPTGQLDTSVQGVSLEAAQVMYSHLGYRDGYVERHISFTSAQRAINNERTFA